MNKLFKRLVVLLPQSFVMKDPPGEDDGQMVFSPGKTSLTVDFDANVGEDMDPGKSDANVGDVLDPGKSGDSEDNCKVCSVANEVCSTGNSHKFHCALCNKCALEDVDLDAKSNHMIVEQLDFYIYYCGSVVEKTAYSHLGDFVWLCIECRTKSVKSMKVSEDRPAWPGLMNFHH